MTKMKSLLFYLNWEEQIDEMTDAEAKRFIKNLCRYSKGEEVELPTKAERLCWLGIVPALEINMKKYQTKVAASQANGRLGGAPQGNQNAKKEETSQNKPNNLIKDNSEQEINNKEKEIDNKEKESNNSEEEIDNSEMEKEKRELENNSIDKEPIPEVPIAPKTPRDYSGDNYKNYGGMTLFEYSLQQSKKR